MVHGNMIHERTCMKTELDNVDYVVVLCRYISVCICVSAGFGVFFTNIQHCHRRRAIINGIGKYKEVNGEEETGEDLKIEGNLIYTCGVRKWIYVKRIPCYIYPYIFYVLEKRQ